MKITISYTDGRKKEVLVTDLRVISSPDNGPQFLRVNSLGHNRVVCDVSSNLIPSIDFLDKLEITK
jgi:hypothetical protein